MNEQPKSEGAEMLFEEMDFTPPSPYRRPAVITPKRAAILRYLKASGFITLAQATKLVGGNVYHNAEKHTGSLLSGMVAVGLLSRTKPGVFMLPKTPAQSETSSPHPAPS